MWSSWVLRRKPLSALLVVSLSAVSASLCGNRGRSTLSRPASRRIVFLAEPSQDGLQPRRAGGWRGVCWVAFIVFYSEMPTAPFCVCEKRCVYSVLLRHTPLSRTFLKASTHGLQGNKTKLVFTHSWVIANISFLIQKYTNRSNGYYYRQLRKETSKLGKRIFYLSVFYVLAQVLYSSIQRVPQYPHFKKAKKLY